MRHRFYARKSAIASIVSVATAAAAALLLLPSSAAARDSLRDRSFKISRCRFQADAQIGGWASGLERGVAPLPKQHGGQGGRQFRFRRGWRTRRWWTGRESCGSSPKPESRIQTRTDGQGAKPERSSGRGGPYLALPAAGLPRMGAPDKIVQTPNEVVFLYSDLDRRIFPHRADERQAFNRSRRAGAVQRGLGGPLGGQHAGGRRVELHR